MTDIKMLSEKFKMRHCSDADDPHIPDRYWL